MSIPAFNIARCDPEALKAECADVLYHMAVMLAAQDLTLEDVLAAREGVSGVAEKAARQR